MAWSGAQHERLLLRPGGGGARGGAAGGGGPGQGGVAVREKETK